MSFAATKTSMSGAIASTRALMARKSARSCQPALWTRTRFRSGAATTVSRRQEALAHLRGARLEPIGQRVRREARGLGEMRARVGEAGEPERRDAGEVAGEFAKDAP